MAWYGNRRSGQPRPGARAVVVGLGIAMVGALAIQTSSTVRSGIDASRRSMDGTTASLAGFASGLAGWSLGFGRSQEDEARIAELEGEVRDLHRWKDLAETMALRMERYEKLLDLVGETQGQAVTARIVAEENGPFAASKIANAGASNGVREGFAAINEYGLVGRVVRVGEYTSRVLLLTDFASRIPRHDRLKLLHEFTKLRGTQVGWRAATEVDVIELAATDHGLPRAEFDFLHEGIRVRLDIAGVFVGVHAEVTELAALPAERNMQIQP